MDRFQDSTKTIYRFSARDRGRDRGKGQGVRGKG